MRDEIFRTSLHTSYNPTGSRPPGVYTLLPSVDNLIVQVTAFCS
jgi:hypothetical protein